MVKVAKTYNVEIKGTGRRDNLGKIVSDRVKTFKGLELLYNEKQKAFAIVASDEVSLFSWVKSPLPVGSHYHLVDVETFLPTPYTVAAGYELKILKVRGSADQPILSCTYLEGQLIGSSVYMPGGVYVEQEIALPTTIALDPDFSDAHIFDATLTNIGLAPLFGSGGFTAVLIDHHSDEKFERDTKKVKCPICATIDTVPISTTKTTCSNGHDFVVEYHPWGGVI